MQTNSCLKFHFIFVKKPHFRFITSDILTKNIYWWTSFSNESISNLFIQINVSSKCQKNMCDQIELDNAFWPGIFRPGENWIWRKQSQEISAEKRSSYLRGLNKDVWWRWLSLNKPANILGPWLPLVCLLCPYLYSFFSLPLSTSLTYRTVNTVGNH